MTPPGNGVTFMGLFDLFIGPLFIILGILAFIQTRNGFSLVVLCFGIIWVGIIVYLMKENKRETEAKESEKS
jgi:hypothetical protein